ncbi:TrbI/VirB10 family protein [Paraburkholderia phenazinium]|uniref:TrbI/VirB10 family protein n=1 Tax=Paraburkholderia phenazinium TaxID=60549 RepID=UPI001588841B|nr:TrbI/VirB10 family protein [Paraburkholderia phenazinium]
MAQANQQPGGEQASIVKGKSPRNAILAVGAVAAIVIASIGFYYQLKQSNEAADEARLLRKERESAAVHKEVNTNDDVDKIISDQIAAAKKQEADARAASAVAAVQAPQGQGTIRPGLTAQGFMNDPASGDIAQKTAQDNIYDSPIFKPGVKVPDPASQQQSRQAGVPTPGEVAEEQAAAQKAAVNAATAQAQALAAAGKAPGQASAQSTQQHDTEFIKDAKAQSASGEGFLATGFVGQSRGCTLSPPGHIQVETIEGLSSDRPGTADLVVEQDVYDSLGNGCLMIPKGSTIVAPYSSDIQPGQESILVAGTELRLPNGKHVPMFGAQGADADGTAGFSGDVNNHFLKIYGTSFLTAILLGAFDKSSTTATTSNSFGVTQVGSTAGQVAATTAQSVLSRYQNVPPTITIKPGQRFMIKVNRDITLEPYRE